MLTAPAHIDTRLTAGHGERGVRCCQGPKGKSDSKALHELVVHAFYASRCFALGRVATARTSPLTDTSPLLIAR